VWEVDLDPVRGHEQAGTRPAVVVSADRFNRGPAGLVVLLPMTTRDRGIPLHVAVEPSESRLGRRGWIKPEDIRSVSVERLGRRLGSVPATALAAVDDRLRVLLDV
jgi:mRNA interferase MazF